MTEGRTQCVEQTWLTIGRRRSRREAAQATALVQGREAEDEALAEPGDRGTWGNLKGI